MKEDDDVMVAITLKFTHGTHPPLQLCQCLFGLIEHFGDEMQVEELEGCLEFAKNYVRPTMARIKGLT